MLLGANSVCFGMLCAWIHVHGKPERGNRAPIPELGVGVWVPFIQLHGRLEDRLHPERRKNICAGCYSVKVGKASAHGAAAREAEVVLKEGNSNAFPCEINSDRGRGAPPGQRRGRGPPRAETRTSRGEEMREERSESRGMQAGL